jgi:hypothetical protein
MHQKLHQVLARLKLQETPRRCVKFRMLNSGTWSKQTSTLSFGRLPKKEIKALTSVAKGRLDRLMGMAAHAKNKDAKQRHRPASRRLKIVFVRIDTAAAS